MAAVALGLGLEEEEEEAGELTEEEQQQPDCADVLVDEQSASLAAEAAADADAAVGSCRSCHELPR